MINGKIAVHMRAPVMTQSGYGAHAREILDYLLADGKFLVALESINWGNCSYLHENDFRDPQTFHDYRQCMLNFEQLKERNVEYDIAIHVSIPNEFQRTGKVCIGVTAGIEVDRVAREWVVKCNEMDLIVVPSEHSAKVLQGTVYSVTNNETGQTVDERVAKPIYIIPEYFKRPQKVAPLDLKFSTKKNFLFVGQWGGKGGFGEDRKNVADMIKMFFHTFKDDAKVGLVLKAQMVNGTKRDLFETKKRINQIKDNFPGEVKCKIHLVHQDLTDDEMWGLYHHPQITGMLNLTHGEGFSRTFLEAASAGLPVLATNWSGHLDFLKKGHGFIPLDFSMVEIPDCQVWEGVIIKGSRWAKIDDESTIKKLKKFMNGPRAIRKQAAAHVEWLDSTFSKDAAWKKWDQFFGLFIKNEAEAEDSSPNEMVPVQKSQKEQAIDHLKSLVDMESDKKKCLYVMPQSAGDCLISTAVIHSLIVNRHWDTDFDFYVATTEPFKSLFAKLEKDFGVKVLDYNHNLMFNAELTREVWDHVYAPGVNVQFTFSNWLLGNGEYSVRLLEEFSKNCNLHPQEITNYQVEIEPCALPESAYIVIAPGGQKSAKTYKYWPDVVENIKKMAPGVKLVQVGTIDEDMVAGALDYRGRSFAESFYVIQNAVMLVGGDSFPAHAAAAMETPHLVIYASTHANACAPLLLTRKVVPQIAIEETTQCSPKCYKDTCEKAKNGEKNCLSHINPKTICLGIEGILKKLTEKEEEEDANRD